MPIVRRTTVTRNPKPQPIATMRSRRLSRTILEAMLGEEYSNSEVIIKIIAVTASQRLMSPTVRGKCIFSP